MGNWRTLGWLDIGPEREEASRDKEGGLNFDEKHHTVANNSRNVSEIPIDDPHYLPFAIVTLQGEWIERGEMGWFGIVCNAKEMRHWHVSVKSVLSKFPDHLAVAVDCHI